MNDTIPKKFTTEDLDRYIEAAQQDEDVLGFFMGGSRGVNGVSHNSLRMVNLKKADVAIH